MEEFAQRIDALAIARGRAGIPNLVMAGTTARPSMNTASKNGRDAQLVPMEVATFDEIDFSVAFRRDEGIVANRGRHSVHGWPGQRPGHDEVVGIIYRIGSVEGLSAA
jgi:hypothetical protein